VGRSARSGMRVRRLVPTSRRRVRITRAPILHEKRTRHSFTSASARRRLPQRPLCEQDGQTGSSSTKISAATSGSRWFAPRNATARPLLTPSGSACSTWSPRLASADAPVIRNPAQMRTDSYRAAEAAIGHRRSTGRCSAPASHACVPSENTAAPGPLQVAAPTQVPPAPKCCSRPTAVLLTGWSANACRSVRTATRSASPRSARGRTCARRDTRPHQRTRASHGRQRSTVPAAFTPGTAPTSSSAIATGPCSALPASATPVF